VVCDVHHEKYIRQPLDADANGSVAHI
jgi:hypothetical protein